MPDLSIVFGTYNRLRYLKPCIQSVRQACHGLDYEFIIVDGGSTDGTLEFLRGQPNMTLIEHGELRGCVSAYNDGFAAASGKYVAYINDDLTMRPDTLQAACELLDNDPNTAIVALRYSNNGGGMTLGYTTLAHGRYPFASFGVLRRELGEQAGWFDGYYHYFGDCHLSLSLRDMGYRLAVLEDNYGVDHFGADNSVRGINRWQTKEPAGELSRHDGALYRERWYEWKGPRHG